MLTRRVRSLERKEIPYSNLIMTCGWNKKIISCGEIFHRNLHPKKLPIYGMDKIDEETIVSCSKDRGVLVWDLSSLLRIKTDNDDDSSVVFDQPCTMERLRSCSEERRKKLIQTVKPKLSLDSRAYNYWKVKYLPNQGCPYSLIGAVSLSGVVQLWNYHRNHHFLRLKVENGLKNLCYYRREDLLFTSGGNVYGWDIPKEKEICRLVKDTNNCEKQIEYWNVQPIYQNSCLLVTAENHVLVWDPRISYSQYNVVRVSSAGYDIIRCVLNYDFVIGYPNGRDIFLIDMRKPGKFLHKIFKAHNNIIWDMKAIDSKLFASCSQDSSVRVWGYQSSEKEKYNIGTRKPDDLHRECVGYFREEGFLSEMLLMGNEGDYHHLHYKKKVSYTLNQREENYDNICDEDNSKVLRLSDMSIQFKDSQILRVWKWMFIKISIIDEWLMAKKKIQREKILEEIKKNSSKVEMEENLDVRLSILLKMMMGQEFSLDGFLYYDYFRLFELLGMEKYMEAILNLIVSNEFDKTTIRYLREQREVHLLKNEIHSGSDVFLVVIDCIIKNEDHNLENVDVTSVSFKSLAVKKMKFLYHSKFNCNIDLKSEEKKRFERKQVFECHAEILSARTHLFYRSIRFPGRESTLFEKTGVMFVHGLGERAIRYLLELIYLDGLVDGMFKGKNDEWKQVFRLFNHLEKYGEYDLMTDFLVSIEKKSKELKPSQVEEIFRIFGENIEDGKLRKKLKKRIMMSSLLFQ